MTVTSFTDNLFLLVSVGISTSSWETKLTRKTPVIKGINRFYVSKVYVQVLREFCDINSDYKS